MTVRETADILHFEILTGGGALDRPIQSVYSCDLLSFVMGRAPADSAWATVMGNVNAMAVAVLADVACVVLAEGAALGLGLTDSRTVGRRLPGLAETLQKEGILWTQRRTSGGTLHSFKRTSGALPSTSTNDE